MHNSSDDPQLRRAAAPDPAAVRVWHRGRGFAGFAVGDAFDHARSRTVTEADAVLFSTASLAYTPAYLDRAAATRSGRSQLGL